MITSDPQTLQPPALRRVLAIMAERGIPVRPDQTSHDLPPVEDNAPAWLRATQARIPARFRRAEASHPQVRAWVQLAVAAARSARGGGVSIVEAPSLLIIGGTGTGKTHAAFGAIRALAAAGVRVEWQATTAADLYAALRPSPGRDTERELATFVRCPLLLLDDLGAAKPSEWTEEITYRLINHRYAQVLPTLITSNVPIRQLRHLLGDRVASRLAEMAERVVLDGVDRRRQAT